jgi:trimeric autotransporter adhesin
VADGTTYEIGITADGSQAAAASSTVDALAAALDRAGAASSAAATALTAGQDAYAEAESTANRAATAAERFGLKADEQRGKLDAALAIAQADGAQAAVDAIQAKLAALASRQEELSGKSAAAAAALDAEAASLAALSAASADATTEQAALASRLEGVANAERENAAAAKDLGNATAGMASKSGGGGVKLNELSESLGKLGGPAGVAGQKIAGVGNAVSKLAAMGPAGIFLALAVAAVAVVAGVAAAGVALLQFGLANADAARTSMLLSAGIAGSVAGGKALQKTISDLGAKVPIATDELQKMAADLAKTGLKGDALSDALETAAVKSAQLKFGPEYAKAMLNADFQSKKLKENIGKIFGGLNTDGFLGAMQKGLALFGENSAAAKAIKVVFESMFQPVVDGLAAMVPKAIAGFLQFEIWALKGLIALHPYKPMFETIGSVVMAMGSGLGTILGMVFSSAMLGLQGLSMLGTAGGDALGWLSAKALEVRAFLQSFSLADVGMAMIDGLTGGLVSSAPKVIAAITGLAGNAVKAAKSALGIASPSKVFAEIGGYTAEGMSQGVDDGAGAVQGSLESLVAPPAAQAGSPAAGASAGGGGNTFQITINAAGGAAQDIANAVREVLLDVLEGDVTQVGGAVPNG